MNPDDNPARTQPFPTRRMPALFMKEPVTLSSGLQSQYKIECDALTGRDWVGLGYIAHTLFNIRFSYALGVPHGGLALAHVMQFYYASKTGPILVVDDVLTTGASMKRMLAKQPDDAVGLVAFARGPITDPRIKAIWRLGDQ